MERLCAEKDGFSHFILGDTDEVINKSIAKVRQMNGDITVTGYSPPFRDFTEEDTRTMFRKIEEAGPDIIWVCFGGGKQEKWMMDHRDRLAKGVMIGVGSALRWITGELKVPPVIFQKLCLQWCYRFASEFVKDPRKGTAFLIERQLRKFPIFLLHFPVELALARGRFEQLNSR